MSTKPVLRRSVAYVLLALGSTALAMPALASGSTHETAASRASAQVAGQQTTDESAKKANKKPQTLQTVSVTASRVVGITDQELVSPQTSVTNLTLHPQLAQNIGLAIGSLPMFANGTTPSSASRSTGAGTTALDLRGLGTSQTLVLLDGQRFIGSRTDLDSVPSILVKNIQVVTGGASAAWGSGAVAGVVNLQLDNSYNGGEVRLTRGISQYGNGQETKFQFKFGSAFAGQKGHFVLGGSVANDLGIGDYGSTTGFTSPLPIGGGKFESFEHVVLDNQAIGGLITSGVLKGMVFNPDGTLRPFNTGTFQSPSSGEQVGGDGYFFVGVNNPLITPYKHYNVLGRATYDINDNVQGYFQAQFAKSWTHSPWLSASTNAITINANNAFLPPAIKDVMQSANESSFTMGRADLDFDPPETLRASTKTQQFTAGLKGEVPDSSWSWNAYVSRGTMNFPQIIENELSTTNFANAVDAVTDPSTGQAVCAIALQDPGTSCVPINLFGEGAPSPAAVQYVTNDSSIFQRETLDVAAASLTGAPLQLPAGHVRVATGVDWRQRSLDESVGPDDVLGDTAPFVFTPLSGKYNVDEWFGEAFIPILRDVPGARRLAVDTAARYSDYSTAGGLWSFKAGFNDQIVKGLRFRGSWSQDIRAPNIGELFSGQNLEINVISNPITGAQNFINQLNGGNPNLGAETSHTVTGGFIYTPQSVPGFTAELNYYNIHVSNVIASPAVQFVVNDCVAGVKSACDLVTFGPDHSITQVVTTDQNFASQFDDGADVDFSYVRPTTLFGVDGYFHARLMGTYIHHLQESNSGVTTDQVADFAAGGVPRWMGFGEAGFSSKRFSLFTTLRLIGPYQIDAGEDIVNNDVSSRVYVNLGGELSLDKSGDLQLGLSVNNVTNLVPNAQTTNIYFVSPMPRYYMLSLQAKL